MSFRKSTRGRLKGEGELPGENAIGREGSYSGTVSLTTVLREKRE